MDFKLNFLGINVADFQTSYHFFSDVLGIGVRAALRGWALFDTTGMMLELFGEGTARNGGQGQAVQPTFQLADLHATVSILERKRVVFAGEIEKTEWGEQITFVALEGMLWTLAHAPDYPYATNLEKPHLGGVEMKAQRLTEQQAVYRDMMGMQVANRESGRVVLRQEPGEPLLFLEPGRQPSSVTQGWHHAPFFISFETKHIERAAAWLTARDVVLVEDVIYREWGGTDILIRNWDGNPVQVVQYGTGVPLIALAE